VKAIPSWSIYLVAAALLVVSVFEVLAWALFAGGYWLPKPLRLEPLTHHVSMVVRA
jgi:hypothetical protein